MARFGVDIDDVAYQAGVGREIEELRELTEQFTEQIGSRIAVRAVELAPKRLGTLAASIYVTPPKREARGASVIVGTEDPVGFYQEFGTSKMDPHPWLRPAFAEAAGHLRSLGLTVSRHSLASTRQTLARARARQRARRQARSRRGG